MRLPRVKVTRVSLVAGLYLIASTAPRVASFLLLPVYAYELSSQELAAYGVAVSVVQLIGIISDAGILPGLGNTYWHQSDAYRPIYLKSTVLLSRIVALIVLIPVGFLLHLFWDPLFGSGLAQGAGLWLLLTFSFLQRGNNLAGAVYRVRKEHHRFTLTKVVPAAVQIVAGLLFVFVLHWGSMGAVSAAPLGFLVSILVVGVRGRIGEKVPFERLSVHQVHELVTRGLPLIPQMLAQWAQLLSLRPLMSLFTNARETAAFTFSTAPAQIVSPFAEAYDQYVAPRYYESAAQDDLPVIRRLRDVTSMYLAVSAIGTMVAIVLFDPVFLLLAPSQYKTTAGLAAIGLSGMMLRGAFGLVVHNLRIEDRRNALIGTVVIGTSVSYVQFFLLARTFGAQSAAWSIYLYPAIGTVVALVALRRTHRQLFDIRDLSVTSGSVFVVLLSMLLLRGDHRSQLLDHYWVLVLVALAGITVVGWQVVRPRLASVAAVVRHGVSVPEPAPSPEPELAVERRVPPPRPE